jgi:hypothetical protein
VAATLILESFLQSLPDARRASHNPPQQPRSSTAV